MLSPIFGPTFISNSLSCRIGKGTHKGIDVLEKITRKISGNAFKPCFVLKCDVKKSFEMVDHSILLNIIRKRIKDSATSRLLEEIIESFVVTYSEKSAFEKGGKDDSLIFFFLKLLSFLQSLGTVPAMDIETYIKQLKQKE